MGMMSVLPEIPVLCPLPGAGRRRVTGGRSVVEPRILDKVRALLAKAESTEFPEEAEAYTAKAQELMARHRIDRAVLGATGRGSEE